MQRTNSELELEARRTAEPTVSATSADMAPPQAQPIVVPPRGEARHALAECRRAGVRVAKGAVACEGELDDALALVAEVGRWLGHGLAGLTLALDPGTVLVGGGLVAKALYDRRKRVRAAEEQAASNASGETVGTEKAEEKGA